MQFSLASVPIPKFVSSCSTAFTNFGSKETSNLLNLGVALVQKSAIELAARMMRTSEPPHQPDFGAPMHCSGD
jgi:hypothetical protein